MPVEPAHTAGVAQRLRRLKTELMPSMHRLALAAGASAWLARRRPARRILMLHDVGPGAIEPRVFDAQLSWLREHFCIIGLPDMVERIEAGLPVRGHGEVALTFDDGLRNHAEYAYPLLLRHRVPATLFVCPDLIQQRRWLWNQEARERLRALAPAARDEFAHVVGAPVLGVEPTVAWMKTCGLDRRRGVERALRDATPHWCPDAGLRALRDPLSWRQLEAMDPRLITIGSHTLDHPILPTLEDAELERQIARSRTRLEQRLQRPVELFCYPNGENDPRARALVARYYRAAVTTRPALVDPAPSRCELPRVPAADSLELLAWRMHRPGA